MIRNIALVAHDNMKPELIEWAKEKKERLVPHVLYATGTTGKLLQQALEIPVISLMSGPLGGDQQIGSLIAEGKIDILIFFWDPLASQPHDPDIKALIRIAAVWNIPVACNRATADFIFSSSFVETDYQRKIPDFSTYLGRKL